MKLLYAEDEISMSEVAMPDMQGDDFGGKVEMIDSVKGTVL